MKKKYRFIYILLFCIITIFKAQSPAIDSIRTKLKTSKQDTNKVNLLNDLSKNWRISRSYDSSLLHAYAALELSKKLNYLPGTGNAYNNLGLSNLALDNYSKALEHFFSSLKLKEKLGDRIGIASLSNHIGRVFWMQLNYKDAIKAYEIGLKINEENHDKDKTAESYNNIGFVCVLQSKTDEALKNYLKAQELYKETNNKKDLAHTYDNIGVVYEKQMNFAEAEKQHLTALKIKNEIGNKKGVSTSYLWLSNVYFGQGNHQKSLDCLLAAMKINEEIKDKSGMAICAHDIGKFYLQIGKILNAKLWLTKGLSISKEINSKSFIKDSYEYLAIADSLSGNFKEAYSDYKKYIIYRDMLVNKENTQKATQAQLQYEFDKRQATDSLKIDEERKLNVAKFQQEKSQRYYLYAGLALVIVFAGIMFNRFKITQKQKRIIEIKEQETREQKHLVDEKQKEILDSITYAKRLQEAILPPQEFVNKYVPDNFILYKPKDLVAGDFYWAENINNLFFIAAADSTGHGVPGAMVSVVCSNALNRAVKEFNLTETGKILDKTRELVLETFEKSTSEVKDGMDISLLCIDNKNKNIYWSGANNPLWYIQNNELKEIKADKQPIGKTEYPKPFTTHQIEFEINTTFYLFTDGFADQFGGPKGKKFKYKQFSDLLVNHINLTQQQQAETINRVFEDWKGNLEQVDDVCVIGIKI